MSQELINKIKSMQWEKWLERPFHAFIFSLFEDSTTKESFEKINIPGVELRVQFAQKGSWYLNHELLEEMDAQVGKYLETHNMFDITSNLEIFRQQSRQKIEYLIGSDQTLEGKYTEIFEILKLACTYIWLAHGVESFYNRKLKEEVPNYIKSNIDKFIGDASFPKKKNAHAKFDGMMRSGAPSDEIAQKFGWLKIRDGFSEPFSVAEIDQMKSESAPHQTHEEIQIPNELKELFNQVQELVFFRTERTDVFYQLFFQSRPIIQEIAKKYNIPFDQMRYYRAKSFIIGNPEKYFPLSTFAYLDGEVIFQNDPIIVDQKIINKEIRGAIAFKGKQQGTVKVVKNVSELEKVLVGDILVTQMTFPSFISAMNRASAFVTDEGGITCHAAIISRELKKPCIVGTKNATSILKDGDLVEVDADKGIVNILNS